MTTFADLKEFFATQDFNMIITADAETRVHSKVDDKIIAKTAAGGVSVALEPIAKASHAVFVGRGKTPEDKQVVDISNKLKIKVNEDEYTLKRVFLSEEETDKYYNGFANQTIWPLCHVAFERPIFNKDWYDGYKRVNKKYADSIKEEIKGKTFIWINDYQLILVPGFLGKPKNTTVALFWHIPWPTWEIFRILPVKKELLESMLMCDFLAFHRGYHVRNFLRTVERELEARTDEETGKVYYKDCVTTVKNLPMGIDSDVIKSLLDDKQEESLLTKVARNILGLQEEKNPEAISKFDKFFENHKVILGVDRLDYTKGLKLRMTAIDQFLRKNPDYIGRMVYLGITAPTREKIPSYQLLKKEVFQLAAEINKKYAVHDWKPIHLIHKTFSREDLLNFYKKAHLCLVTPLDDGMNLVSKEFVIASSYSPDPGMLVLSQFAGSAIDLTYALIVNPYDIDKMAEAIKKGLEMRIKEKHERIKNMVEIMDEKNVYEWAKEFTRSAQLATRENRL